MTPSILANPVMFDSISNKTFYIYGALNFAWIPLVYLFWPKVKTAHALNSDLMADLVLDSEAFT